MLAHAGNSPSTDAWVWHCRFHPGSNPGDGSNGTAVNLEAGRAAFQSAWSAFLSKRSEADFLEVSAAPRLERAEARHFVCAE
ncbi:MAG TPA: hypothetical protein VMM15_42875 [Bradyrhizobium sp.]|nr:hypothetical protein [Bradyrhizobium sp.]